ncbi:MAG: hypothetical protein JXB14_01025 [Candidatus Altiarchaeota archaeon]|nr:hypothetical protein [Candidatus Altiarchaeota archaeon]
MSKLVVFGGIVLDYLCKVEDASKECTQVTTYGESLGGMGYNTASAAAQLGVETELVAAVGGDFPKVKGTKNLKLTLTRVKGLKTTRSFLFYDGKEERVYFFRGSYHEYEDKNAKKAIRGADFIHLAGVLPMFPKYAKTAREFGRTVSLNPGYDLFHYDPKDRIVVDLLENSDFMILNEREYERIGAFKELWKNKKALVVTRGEDGCSVFENAKKTDIGSFKVNAASPFGAGDSFTGGFLASVIKGYSIMDSARIASACASFAVEVEDTVPVLSWDKILERSRRV